MARLTALDQVPCWPSGASQQHDGGGMAAMTKHAPSWREHWGNCQPWPRRVGVIERKQVRLLPAIMYH